LLKNLAQWDSGLVNRVGERRACSLKDDILDNGEHEEKRETVTSTNKLRPLQVPGQLQNDECCSYRE
jgi:hypothetical protein